MEAEGMIVIVERTGVKKGAKGIHPTPTTTNIDRDRSVVSRPTATEVGRDECWSQGKRMGGYEGERRGDWK